MKMFDGNLLLESSAFENIIGSSGSVLHVGENYYGAQYDVVNSTFNENFATRGFPNIFIAMIGSNFPGISRCPVLNLMDSTFTNAYGCPGSYGNNIYICYWDSSSTGGNVLGIDAFSYAGGFNLETYLQHNDPPYVTIQGSTFRDNILAVSNSLAVIGSVFTVLNNNTFEHNGGSTAEILIDRLEDSYFATRYPDGYDPLSFFLSPHFGQSTVVFFDRVVKINSINNQYINNWGAWEGSFALGECLTVKNWIRIAGSLNFQSDSYINHHGIPDDIGDILSDTSLRNNVYMSPLITFSYDDAGTTYAYSKIHDASLTGNVSIAMDNITFYNNTLSYDLAQYTYNEGLIDKLLSSFNMLSPPNRLSTGLIKFLTAAESNDIAGSLSQTNPEKSSVGLTLPNSNISQNQLLTSGCLFANQWIDTYTIANSQVIGNQIPDDPIIVSEANSSPDLSRIDSLSRGMLCGIADDTMTRWDAIKMTVSNMTAYNNTGVMFLLPSGNKVNATIGNSVFKENKCLQAGLINIFKSSTLTFIGNTFIQNFISLGNVFVYDYGRYSAENTTYLGNVGVHASLVFSSRTNSSGIQEVYTNARLNDIKMEAKFFLDKITPQGALYYISSGYASIRLSEFRENIGYSGLFVAINSQVAITKSAISDNYVNGSGIIGSFFAGSVLSMDHCNLVNNSLISDGMKSVTPQSFAAFYVSHLIGNTLNFADTTLHDGAILIFCNGAVLNTTNINIHNTVIVNDPSLQENQNSGLIELFFSTAYIVNLESTNSSGLFIMQKTDIEIHNFTLTNINVDYSEPFIIQSTTSDISINGLVYTENNLCFSEKAMIQGSNTFLRMNANRFINTSFESSTIINLEHYSSIIIFKTSFEYAEGFQPKKIFDFSEVINAVISSCTFTFAGQIINTQKAIQLIFTNNVIISDPSIQNIFVEESAFVYMEANIFIGECESDEIHLIPGSLTNSHIEVVDTPIIISIVKNTFLSLCGQSATLVLQSQNFSPLNVNISDNVFINNKALLGGSIYLGASIQSDGFSNTIIEKSVFVQNKARSSNSVPTSGRGGAIYQTSPTQIHQDTQLTGNIFLNNTADLQLCNM